MGVCKGCNRNKKLIKAHVIPESFFRDMRDHDGGGLHQYSAEYPGRRKRRPIGFYDKQILCAECDQKLGVVDAYGYKTLIQRQSEIQKSQINGHTNYRLLDVNGLLFRRFLIAVLWRASISKSGMCAEVNLGKTEKLAKNIAFGVVQPKVKDFPYIILKYNPDKINGVIANPNSFRDEKLKFVRLFLPGYAIHIKTCTRPVPKLMQSSQFLDNGIQYMTGKYLRDLSVYNDIRDMAEAG